jgi:hypothetical protein
MEKYKGQSFTQCEYTHAVDNGKDILVFIMSDDHVMPVSGICTEYREAIAEFKKALAKKHMVAYFNSIDNLVLEVYVALRNVLDDWQSKENDSGINTNDEDGMMRENQCGEPCARIVFIGKGENERFYYIADTFGFNFEQFYRNDGKVEIGSDWDNTPVWGKAVNELKDRMGIKTGEKSEEFPDYTGNGARHNRGAHFVFSVNAEITKPYSFYYR